MIVLWIILGILLFIIGLIVFIFCSKTKVSVFYKDEKIKIRFQNGFLRYTWKPKQPLNEPKKEEVTKENIEKEVNKKKQSLSDKTSFLWKLLGGMRYRVEVKKIKIKVSYGTGDPFDTGFLYGIIWAAIGNLYQLFNQYLIFDFPEVELSPDFENKVFDAEFKGIIKVRLIHIIRALIKSAKK